MCFALSNYIKVDGEHKTSENIEKLKKVINDFDMRKNNVLSPGNIAYIKNIITN